MKITTKTMHGLAASLLFTVPAFASETAPDDIPDLVAGWDHLWFELMVDLLIIGGIFGVAAIYMLIKYRAKSPDDVGHGPKLSTAQMWGWALIPAFIFLADDLFLAARGWNLWIDYRTVPANALEVKVIAGQWYWEFDYGDDVTSDVLKVPLNRPVVLRMTSEDVIHSFFLPDHRVKEDMMPGRITYLWFHPTKLGTTFVTCAEFCGTNHSDMVADVVTVPEAEFHAWLDAEKGIEVASAQPVAGSVIDGETVVDTVEQTTVAGEGK
jgi:cytochrome c oxidase subunit 2